MWKQTCILCKKIHSKLSNIFAYLQVAEPNKIKMSYLAYSGKQDKNEAYSCILYTYLSMKVTYVMKHQFKSSS